MGSPDRGGLTVTCSSLFSFSAHDYKASEEHIAVKLLKYLPCLQLCKGTTKHDI